MVPLNDPTAPPALELVAETVAEAELLVINPALYKDPANPPMLKDPETVALELTLVMVPSTAAATPPATPPGDDTFPLTITFETVELALT
jgi:hypothetical protein